MAGDRSRKQDRCQCGTCKVCAKRAYDQQRYASRREQTIQRAVEWQRANRERKAAYDRQRREALGDEIRSEKRAYYQANRARIAAEGKDRYQRERPARMVKARARYAANREDRIKKAAEWARRNPERAKATWRSSVARRRGVPYTSLGIEFSRVLIRDPCSYCGTPATAVDHITPISRGGDGDWENLTAACGSCNSSKNAKSLLLFMATRLAPRSHALRG